MKKPMKAHRAIVMTPSWVPILPAQPSVRAPFLRGCTFYRNRHVHRTCCSATFDRILWRIPGLANIITGKMPVNDAEKFLSGLRGIGPYVNEVRELVWSLLRHLDELGRLSKMWQEHSHRADTEVAKAPN